jgi:LPS export ABC transporter protein LptC
VSPLSSRAQRGIRTSALALLAITILVAQSCKQATKPPVGGVPSAADSADQIIYDGHTMLTDGGVKRGEMFADTIFVFENQTRFALRRVRAQFNTELGAKNGTLTGDRGTYDLRSRILEGFGNVIVTSTDGKELKSPHLKYSETSNLISSDSAFTATEGDKISTGIGFTSDPNLRSIRCFRACGGSGLVPIGQMKKP